MKLYIYFIFMCIHTYIYIYFFFCSVQRELDHDIFASDPRSKRRFRHLWPFCEQSHFHIYIYSYTYICVYVRTVSPRRLQWIHPLLLPWSISSFTLMKRAKAVSLPPTDFFNILLPVSVFQGHGLTGPASSPGCTCTALFAGHSDGLTLRRSRLSSVMYHLHRRWYSKKVLTLHLCP